MRKKEEERERKEREGRKRERKEKQTVENTASCYNMARVLIP
jgi:hypothetical protein